MTDSMTRVVQQDGLTVIELGPAYDSLDQETLGQLEKLAMELAATCQPPYLIIDMARTGYIGSSFIEFLVRLWKRLRARGGALALCSLQPFCAEVLRVTRLDSLWQIYNDRDAATAGLATR